MKISENSASAMKFRWVIKRIERLVIPDVILIFKLYDNKNSDMHFLIEKI